MEWPDEVLTAVSSTPCDHDILVGTAAGHIAHYDIRMTHKGNFCEFLPHFFPSFFEIIYSWELIRHCDLISALRQSNSKFFGTYSKLIHLSFLDQYNNC